MVIAIIGLLIALLLPAVQAARGGSPQSMRQQLEAVGPGRAESRVGQEVSAHGRLGTQLDRRSRCRSGTKPARQLGLFDHVFHGSGGADPADFGPAVEYRRHNKVTMGATVVGAGPTTTPHVAQNQNAIQPMFYCPSRRPAACIPALRTRDHGAGGVNGRRYNAYV